MVMSLIDYLERLKKKDLLLRISLKAGNFLFGKIATIDIESNQVFIVNDRDPKETHIISLENIRDVIVWRMVENEYPR